MVHQKLEQRYVDEARRDVGQHGEGIDRGIREQSEVAFDRDGRPLDARPFGREGQKEFRHKGKP